MSSESKPSKPEGSQREADIYYALAWLEANKVTVGVVVGILVLIGFGIGVYRYVSDQKEASASAELLTLKPMLTPQTNAPPPQASAFMKVVEQYPGTSAAERARIFAASALFNDGKYADAERDFNDFLSKYPESPWAPEAAYGVAAAREAQNKLDQAQSSYQTVLTSYPKSWVVDQAKLSLARVYELRKQPEQALRLYNELLAPRPGAGVPGGPENREAAERKEALLRQHPNLNTNLLAAASPPPILPHAAATNLLKTNAPATSTNKAAVSKSIPTNAPAKPSPVTTPAKPK